MTVRGGMVKIEAGPVCNNPPTKIYAKIYIAANFPEDTDEIANIIHTRLTEAQCKINLDINPEGLRE